MNLKIYYTWQSVSPKTNYNFILDCMSEACHNIESKGSLLGVHFQIINLKESPANDEFGNLVYDRIGSQDIVEKFKNDLRKSADVFVYDLSTTSVTCTWSLKQFPVIGKVFSLFLRKNQNKVNENVAYEKGLGDLKPKEQQISIMNTYFGEPSGLPFDFRNESLTIRYCYPEREKKTKKIEEIRKALILEFERYIKDSAVFSIKDKERRYQPFYTYYYQKTTFENLKQPKYIENEALKNLISEINKKRNEGGILRLIGLSGLGKTRLVYEAFSSDDESRNNYLYCDCYATDFTKISHALDEIKSNNEQFVLVLDNCEKDLFDLIRNFKNQNAMKNLLITIFNDPSEHEDGLKELDNVSYYHIETKQVEDVVEKLASANDIPQDIQKQIIFLAKGNVQLAYLLRKAYLSNRKSIIDNKWTDEELKNKLLGDSKDSQERIILQSYALFDFIGIEHPNEKQYKFVAKNKHISQLKGDDVWKENEFYKVYKEKKHLFEKNGSLVNIRPKALAFWLAEEWFDVCSPERLNNVFLSLDENKEVGSVLIESMAKQIKYLSYNENVKYLLEKLLGDGTPFRNPESLKSLAATRLFRSFAEINPVATADILLENVNALSLEDLKEMLWTRRNLVWAADTLCFDGNTFEKGAKIMLRLAASENEGLGNNATNEFVRLFSISLPGTEANLLQRFMLLQWGIEQKEYKTIVIKAIARALSTGNAVYWGGAEKQGFIKKQNYRASEKEVFDYQSRCLWLLFNGIRENDEYAMLYEDVVCDTLVDIFKFNIETSLLEKIEEIINYKIENNDGEWPVMRDKLYETKKLFYRRMPKSLKEKFDELLAKLTKDDFATRFKDTSRSFMYDDSDSFDGSQASFQRVYDLAKSKYRELANEFVSHDNWLEEDFISIYTSSGLYEHLFGLAVAELYESNEVKAKEFLDKSVDTINSVEKYDLSVLSGFLTACKDDVYFYGIDEYIDEEKITAVFFRAAGARDGNLGTKNYLFDGIEKNPKWILYIGEDFASNYNWYKDNSANIYPFLEKLLNFNEYGITAFLDTIHKIFYFAQKDAYIDLMEKIVNLLVEKYRENAAAFNFYRYCDFASFALEKYSVPELAKLTNTLLIDKIKKEKMIQPTNWYKDLYSQMTKFYFDEIWLDFFDALISTGKDDYIYFNLLMNLSWMKTIDLHRDKKMRIKNKDVFNSVKNKEKLIESCKQSPDILPMRLARICPVFDDDYKVTDFFHLLVSEFGNDLNVLKSISENLNNVMVSGSMVPYYKMQQDMWKEFLVEVKSATSKNWIKEKIDALTSAMKGAERNEREEDKMYGDFV